MNLTARYQNQNGTASLLIKTWKIMRITTILLLTAALQVSARGLSQKVTLSCKKEPLQNVFAQIRKQTGYIVFCDYSILEKSGTVTVDLKDTPLKDMLTKVLSEMDLSFSIEDRTIVVTPRIKGTDFLHPPGVLAEIIGRVTNERGEPMAFVSVEVIGRNSGTQTDGKGYFRIKAGSADSLAFSYVGYEPQRI